MDDSRISFGRVLKVTGRLDTTELAKKEKKTQPKSVYTHM